MICFVKLLFFKVVDFKSTCIKFNIENDETFIIIKNFCFLLTLKPGLVCSLILIINFINYLSLFSYIIFYTILSGIFSKHVYIRIYMYVQN